ncbi:MAG: ScyD/ScyE family protein [Actinomycetota bacterium]|nr:ScyD/ScyE family protein [Actinomycetota bacterium]
MPATFPTAPHRSRGRLVRRGVVAASAALVAATFPSGGAATARPADGDPLAVMAGKYTVVRAGLDNPRQIDILARGQILVAEAGRGAKNPDGCDGRRCTGRTGRITVLNGRTGRAVPVMQNLLSNSGPDGSFAGGASGGAARRPQGGFVAIMNGGPPGSQWGKLLGRGAKGNNYVIADISRFEQKNDPDGEGVESNPYSVLALKNQILVADAAGDSILSVRRGKVRLWALLPEYGPRVDAVPTVLSKGADGDIYVGELHSFRKGEAKVHRFDRDGNLLRSWGGFTSVAGVDRAENGTLYVSELFGGNCGFDEIPGCFPGRVVKVVPGGERRYLPVPFPSGIAVNGQRAVVAAFSVSPGTGFGGNPAWSGAVWRLRF